MSDLTRYRRTTGNPLQSGNVTVTPSDGRIIDGHVHWIPDDSLQAIADAWNDTTYRQRAVIRGTAEHFVAVLEDNALVEGTPDIAPPSGCSCGMCAEDNDE